MRQPCKGRRTPRKSLVGPTLFAIFGFALLAGLGTWQVERLHWKEGLIAERAAAVTAPPIALPATLAAARGAEFRHVSLDGRFLGAREFRVHALSMEGDDGYHAVAPFALAEGGIVLVDRGFVPVGAVAAPPPAAAGKVTGLLRLSQGKPSYFTPDNRPASNEWFYVDPAAMAAADGLTGVLPFYVDADAGPIREPIRSAGRRCSTCPTTICNTPSRGTRWRRRSSSITSWSRAARGRKRG